jgi:hypothetical protein
MLVEHMSRGLSYESFSADIDVTRDCLYKWEKKYPQFLYAKKKGQEKMTKLLEGIGLSLATGKLQGNVAAWIFLCKNKIGYTDKTEITGNADKPIQLKYSLDQDPDLIKPQASAGDDDQSGEEN